MSPSNSPDFPRHGESEAAAGATTPIAAASETSQSKCDGSYIYVASSWRCARQPIVVEVLRAAGHEVYDFREPKGPGSRGFSWHELDPSIPAGPADLRLPADQIRTMLWHPVADDGFASDMDALRACDICVLVLPCGRSAHLEAGWAVGAGKFTVVLLDDGEPDLMWKMADELCVDIAEVVTACCEWSELRRAA